MPPLYVVQQNTKLRLSNRRVQVEKDDPAGGPAEVLVSLPLGQVSQVVLFGNVGLTTPLIDALLAEEREVVFLTQRGEFRGRLSGSITPHVPLRKAQYHALDRPEVCLGLARGFAAAKLSHQRALLMRHNRELEDPAVGEAIEQIGAALEGVRRKAGLPSLRGLEGSATAAYFSGLRRFFGPEWNFQDRNRRPPADPVNVLLSFGYTLMAQAANAAVQTVGLDPYAGFLHEVAYNRPALALDLMEEFRPVVDGIVLWCCRGGQLTPEDFSPGPAERPVVLSERGAKRFVSAYEERMEMRFTHPIRGEKLTMRQCLIEQARQLAACLQSGTTEWRGMGFR